EDHGQRLPRQRFRGRDPAAPLLHGAACREHPAQLFFRNVDEVEKVAHPIGAHGATPSLRGCVFAASRLQARSMRRTASATSSSLTMSGGKSRTTLSPEPTAIILSARSSSTSSP